MYNINLLYKFYAVAKKSQYGKIDSYNKLLKFLWQQDYFLLIDRSLFEMPTNRQLPDTKRRQIKKFIKCNDEDEPGGIKETFEKFHILITKMGNFKLEKYSVIFQAMFYIGLNCYDFRYLTNLDLLKMLSGTNKLKLGNKLVYLHVTKDAVLFLEKIKYFFRDKLQLLNIGQVRLLFDTFSPFAAQQYFESLIVHNLDDNNLSQNYGPWVFKRLNRCNYKRIHGTITVNINSIIDEDNDEEDQFIVNYIVNAKSKPTSFNDILEIIKQKEDL